MVRSSQDRSSRDGDGDKTATEDGAEAAEFVRPPDPEALTQAVQGEIPGREPPLMTGPPGQQDRVEALSLVASHYRVANAVFDAWATSFGARLNVVSQLINFQGTTVSQEIARGLLPLITSSVVGGPALHIVALIIGGPAGAIAEIGAAGRAQRSAALSVEMIDEFMEQFIEMKFRLMNGQTDLENAIRSTEDSPYWGEERSLVALVERELGSAPPKVTAADFHAVDERVELELWRKWAQSHWQLRLGVDWTIRGANEPSKDRLRARFGINLRDREVAIGIAEEWGMEIVRQPIPRF